MDRHVAESLKEFATPGQWDKLQAIVEHGSERAAAQALGVSRGTINSAVERVKAKAAKRGYSPEHGLVHKIPDGFKMRGASTCYHAEKGQILQWVKTSEDRERQAELMREAINSLCDEVPKFKPIAPPDGVSDDLMAVYPMGDPHIGMMSWHEETGADFDIKIARRDLCAAVDYLVKQVPKCRRGLIINTGDYFHASNFDGTTSRSGNILDMDSRYPKMVRVGVAAMRQCIDSCLEHHEFVDVINVPGNHDQEMAHWMSILLANVYENEPRVKIHDEPKQRHYFEFGKVLIGSVHGHQTKDRDLPGIMATEKPEEWGRTKYRFWFRGHHHHDSRQEYNGCIVEQVRTLAAGDAYAVGGGYLSGRDMKGIVMHKDFGEVSRVTCSVDILRSQ